MKKKVLALMLALVMALGMSVSVFADPPTYRDSGDIIINNVVKGAVLELYQILSYKLDLDNGNFFDVAFIEIDGDEGDTLRQIFIEAIQTKLDSGFTYTTDKDLFLFLSDESGPLVTKSAFATYLAEKLEAALAGIVAPDEISDAATSNQIIFDGVPMGYYLILDVTKYDELDPPVALKNDDPRAILWPMYEYTAGKYGFEINVKTDTELNVPTKTTQDIDVSVGDTITYTVTVQIPQLGEDKDYYEFFRITDVLPKGLEFKSDFNDTFTLEVNGVEPTPAATYYTVTTDPTDEFTVEFKLVDVSLDPDPAVQKLFKDNVGKEIVLTFEVLVTEALADEDGFINTVKFFSSDYEYDDAKCTSYTYGFSIFKYDGDEDADDLALEGVEFQLYLEETDYPASPMLFTKNAAGVFLYDPENGTVDTLITDEDGNFTVWGLASGTYYLKETRTNDGYNLLKDLIEITVLKDGTNVDENITYYEIANYTGLTLDGTGGMGTYVFTVAGLSVLLGAAALILFNRKRIFGK